MLGDDVRAVLTRHFADIGRIRIRHLASYPIRVNDIGGEGDGLPLVRAEPAVRHVAVADQYLIAPHVYSLVLDTVSIHERSRREDEFGVVAELRNDQYILLEDIAICR